MNKKIIEINGKKVKAGEEVLLKVKLIKESGAGGEGYNLEIPFSQGGAIVTSEGITLIHMNASQIIINK